MSGWVGVQLSSFHGALSSGGSFYYHAALTASGAAPPLGPERGGTRVTVLGGGFRDAYTLRCAFGAARRRCSRGTSTSRSSSARRRCTRLGASRCVLSMNGSSTRGAASSYTYQPSASVSYISPSRALAEGGTPLTVHGGGFSSASEALGVLTCRIGGAVRRAVWASAFAIVCNATRAAAGGGARRGEQQRARVHVERRALRLVSVRVLDVQPWSGPVGGATVVSVRAHGSWPGGSALPLRRGERVGGRRRGAAARRVCAA